MAATVKTNSICPACNSTPSQAECVECFMCKSHYHAICEGANEVLLGTKTMVITFVAASTKSNFKFFCDAEFERNLVETEDQKMNGLVNKVNSMDTKLIEITKLLKSPSQLKAKPGKPVQNSVWNDEEKLATVKAPPQNSVLVIKKSITNEQNVEIQDQVQQIMIQNNIPVTQSFMNKSGDMVMVCETQDDRDKMKNLMSNSNEEIVMNAPAEKRPAITIVGLKKEHGREEMLVLQNAFIKRFANSNDINDHIKIFAVRSLKNNPNCYQAFASVSTTLREGFNYFKNKVTIGLASCKIYDRYHIKRCNICQHFGHYMKDCPTPDEHACGKCGGDHNTNECVGGTPKCVNCVRKNGEDSNHCAYSHKCPLLIEQQESLKSRLNYNNRNRPQHR